MIINVCDNCGCQLQPDDRFCPKCGSPVPNAQQADNTPGHHPQQPAQPQQLYQQPQQQLQPKSSVNWKLVAIVAAVVIAAGGACYYMISKSNGEQAQWEVCEESTDVADFEKYISDYPDGAHIADVKTLYAKLKADNELWEKTVNATDAATFRTYISSFPSGVHLDEAKQKLDDIVWNDAFSSNSAEQYLAYMQEFPTGKHYQDAQNAYNKIQATVMTAQDQENVRSTVEQFFAGLETFDAQAMQNACTQPVTFMGKRSSLNDLRQYVDAYRNSDIQAIDFSGLNLQATKQADAQGKIQYRATFTVDRLFQREDVEKGTLSTLKGTAVLNQDYRITSITFDKAAQY